jgi:hypothetical protein
LESVFAGRGEGDLDCLLAIDDGAAEDWSVRRGALVEADRGFEPALVTTGNGVQSLALLVANVKFGVGEAGFTAVDFEG